jgi:hypothetical protein
MKRNILVTGAHRSGSTWTGKIIAESKQVRYVQEPFNLAIKKYKTPLKHWFEHLNSETEANYQEVVKRYLQSFYSTSFQTSFQNLKQIRSATNLYSFLLDVKRRNTCRTLFKDPIALMAAEWFYKEMNCDIILTIRHPAAFIASLKVKDWQFNFNNFLKQDILMQKYLEAYRNEIVEQAASKKDIIEQGILLWKALHYTILQYRERYCNEWYFVKHEDLSIDPLDEFEKIFKFLQLNFSEEIKNKIKETTTSTINTTHKRDARQNIKTWKDRLSKEEIGRIKEETRIVWQHFYSEEDW